ncbi:MAG: FAD-dependent oxidoreductase [Pseudomonadota bacterium]
MLQNLFEPITLGSVELKNRIVSTGHETFLDRGGLIDDELVAYHEARARGGAGLIITEVASVHVTARPEDKYLLAHTDDCIPGYARLAEAVHAHGAKLFAQLFHPGRFTGPFDVWAPSEVQFEWAGLTARPMPLPLIKDIIQGYGEAAGRMKEAGLDGVEIVASHGYLPMQFLNPRLNQRADEYGGSYENRMRFLIEVAEAIRENIGDDMALNIRISVDEMDHEGLDQDEALEAIQYLTERDLFDCYNTVLGSISSSSGWAHVVPPMRFDAGYTAPYSAAVKAVTDKPVLVSGRINQPQIADAIIGDGQADLCAMTRSMITDPEMPNKAKAGLLDDIRACIGCNQACIGRVDQHMSVSCIQRPESGRELAFLPVPKAEEPKSIMVVGGGPAGMKAAISAAQRGHHVTLYERESQLGGQVKLAQLLPHRAEFGGLITNFARELEIEGVEVKTNTAVTEAMVRESNADMIYLATGGSETVKPGIEGLEEGLANGTIVPSWEVIQGKAKLGGSVVIADWLSGWPGLGVAEKLALEGHSVRYVTPHTTLGRRFQTANRDLVVGSLFKLGVQTITDARIFGFDEGTAYFQHTANGEPLVLEDVDTLVMCNGVRRNDTLVHQLSDWQDRIHVIGDCMDPLDAEFAILGALMTVAATL